jgi:DNA-binding transcriptional MerR regulator
MPARFTIRAASALTGINANTLRAWERRYGLLRPQRTPKGYRLYTEDDIQRLRLVQRALQQGISVGRVMDHIGTAEAVERLIEETKPETADARPSRTLQVSLAGAGLSGTASIRLPARGPTSRSTTLQDLSEQIERATLRFDRAGLERAFGRAVGMYSLREAFVHALAPALQRVGERYLRNPGAVAEEHFLTAFAREKLLASLAGLRPLHQRPRVLCACVPGEQHEIMLMLLGLEAGLEGLSTLYLGADVPAAALVHAVEDSGVRAVVLSATVVLPREELVLLQRRLRERARRVTVFIGGPAAARERDWLEQNGYAVLPLDVAEASAMVLGAVQR